MAVEPSGVEAPEGSAPAPDLAGEPAPVVVHGQGEAEEEVDEGEADAVVPAEEETHGMRPALEMAPAEEPGLRRQGGYSFGARPRGAPQTARIITAPLSRSTSW